MEQHLNRRRLLGDMSFRRQRSLDSPVKEAPCCSQRHGAVCGERTPTAAAPPQPQPFTTLPTRKHDTKDAARRSSDHALARALASERNSESDSDLDIAPPQQALHSDLRAGGKRSWTTAALAQDVPAHSGTTLQATGRQRCLEPEGHVRNKKRTLLQHAEDKAFTGSFEPPEHPPWRPNRSPPSRSALDFAQMSDSSSGGDAAAPRRRRRRRLNAHAPGEYQLLDGRHCPSEEGMLQSQSGSQAEDSTGCTIQSKPSQRCVELKLFKMKETQGASVLAQGVAGDLIPSEEKQPDPPIPHHFRAGTGGADPERLCRSLVQLRTIQLGDPEQSAAAPGACQKAERQTDEEAQSRSSSRTAASRGSGDKPSRQRVQLKKIQLKGSVTDFMEEVGKVPDRPALEHEAAKVSSPSPHTRQSFGDQAVPTDVSELDACPFCSNPLPRRMTRALRTMLQPLLDQYHRTGGYVGGQHTVGVCMRHEDERVTVPQGLDEGWPTMLDPRMLLRRVRRSHWKHLLECLNRPETSRFFLGQVGRIKTLGQRALSVSGQMSTAADQRAGYYGERGWETLLTMCLVELLPCARRSESPETYSGETNEKDGSSEVASAAVAVNTRAIAPLTPTVFVHSVLVPELIVSLLREDLRSRNLPSAFEDAIALRDKSTRYGSALFAVDQRAAVDPVSVDRLRKGLDEVDKSTLAGHWAAVLPASVPRKPVLSPRPNAACEAQDKTHNPNPPKHDRTVPAITTPAKKRARPRSSGAPQAKLNFLVQRDQQ